MKVFIIGGTTVFESDPAYSTEVQNLAESVTILGACLADSGHDLCICSPFPDSADLYAAQGAIPRLSNAGGLSSLDVHYLSIPDVTERVKALQETSADKRRVRLYGYPAPSDPNDREALTHSWLFAQINALESCSVVLAIGGKLNGSSGLLLRLAEGKRKPTIPFAFLGGAANAAYERSYYSLKDSLGESIAALHDSERMNDVPSMLSQLAAESTSRILDHRAPSFFISYPRARPEEADFVETLLRRRNLPVFRDESTFEVGSHTQDEIVRQIDGASVFIALWSKEYACSPWCYDELELAVDRHEKESLALWIICIDETRIVPPRAREILNLRAGSRDELEKQVMAQLERYVSPQME